VSRPYLAVAVAHLNPQRPTHTEQLAGRLFQTTGRRKISELETETEESDEDHHSER
jgi:hypothetical protein